jgi:hypothetical protein
MEGAEVGSWIDVERDAAEHHGVTCVRRATDLGVSAATFHRRASHDQGWRSPHPGVRTSPTSVPGLKRDLLVATYALRGTAAASGQLGAWLHDLRRSAPERLEVVSDRRGHLPTLGYPYVLRRARWLRRSDVVEVDGVPVLRVPALLVAVARWPQQELRALLIDALHHGMVTLPQLTSRLDEVRSVAGLAGLRSLAADLGDRVVESVFHDEVLEELDALGYQPSRRPARIGTPDGRGLRPDIPLPWKVAVEPEGDVFHRTREQRRKDRRRAAQYAGTDWRYVPVDWRDWHLDRTSVLASIDAAVLAQHRAGHGADTPLPPHLS